MSRGGEADLAVQQKLYEYEAEFEAQNAALREAYGELSRSRNRYRTLFEEAPVALVVVDEDTRVLQINRRAEALLDRARDRILRRPLMSQVAPVHHPSLRANLDIVLSQRHFTTTIVRLARTQVELWVRVDCGQLDLGGHRRLLLVLHDITRQHLAEDAMRKSEARFRALFEASGDAVALLDGASLTLQEVNPAFVRITSIVPEELIGTRVRALFPEEQRWAVSATLRQSLHHGDAGPLAVSLDVEDRPRRRVALSAKAVRVGGGLFAMITLRDMTEQWKAVERRRQLEQQLWQVHRVELMGAMAGGVVAGMSQRLRQIEEALWRVELSSDALAEARAAAVEGQSLAAQLLGMTSSEQESAEVRFDELVDDSIVRLRASFSGIRVRTGVVDRDLRVEGQRGELAQAVDHLLSVAAHAREDGGGLLVEAEVVQLQESEADLLVPGRYVRLLIRGERASLDVEMLRAARAPSVAGRSTGQGARMGYAVAHATFGEHGGRVALDLTAGSIQAWLPELAVEVSAPAGELQSVLILDDDPLVRRAAARMLTTDGFRVRLADRVEDALDSLRLESFAFVLLNLDMAGERADEILDLLHALEPRPYVLSIGAGAAGRADAALHKPFGTEGLRRAMVDLDRGGEG